MWTENFQMFKLDLKRQRNQRSNCQHLLHIEKARKFQKSIYFCFIDYSKAFECVDHNKLENFPRDGNFRSLTWLLTNLYAGQEATVRTGHGTTDWFQIGKGVCQGCILSDAFELWWWRRLLRVPWTARRSNVSVLKEISLQYSVKVKSLSRVPLCELSVIVQ